MVIQKIGGKVKNSLTLDRRRATKPCYIGSEVVTGF